MTETTILILVAMVVTVALLLLFLLRGRKQRVDFGTTTGNAIRPPVPPTPAEGHGLASEVAAAIEDVVDQFVGLDAHPSGNAANLGPGDALTTLKGLGPKAAARLAELGVTRFDQIAAWDAGDIAAIDARMGAFKGRIARDRWVEQARLLAAGDRETFEQAFGKLG